jgi:hypothetical protein
MRSNVVIGLLVLVALVAGGLFLLSGSERGRGDVETGARSVERPSGIAEPETVAPEGEVPAPDRRAEVAGPDQEEPAAARPDDDPTRGAGIEGPGHPLERFGVTHPMKEWMPCFELVEPELTRECIQAKLQGRQLLPQELADIVCGTIPPDGADRMLIEEVVSLWPPDQAPAHIRTFHAGCNAPSSLWAGFVEVQAERDPEWLAAFAQALTPEEVYSGDDLVLLQALGTMVGLGDPQMRALLEAGARGELGGGDQQVAYSVSQTAALYKVPGEQLDYLRSIARSPAFEGRPAEVEAVVRSVLEGMPMLKDPKGSLALVEELYEDPLFATGVAGRVLELHRWDRLPSWLSEADRRALVARARDVLPSDS